MAEKGRVDWVVGGMMFFAGALLSVTIELLPTRSWLQYVGGFVAIVLAHVAGIIRALDK